MLHKRQVDNISRDDFDNILQYSEMCEPSAKTLWTAENGQWPKNHGQEAVDDYMEFADSLDGFEVIVKRFALQRTLHGRMG